MKHSKCLTISMISSDGCDRCKLVEKRIADASKRVGVPVEIVKIDSRLQAAIELGVKYGLDDVPSFVINGKGYSGDSFHDAEIEAAIKGFKVMR